MRVVSSNSKGMVLINQVFYYQIDLIIIYLYILLLLHYYIVYKYRVLNELSVVTLSYYLITTLTTLGILSKCAAFLGSFRTFENGYETSAEIDNISV